MHFVNCHTAADCKARYRELAKELHPDKQGGSTIAFQKMQAEYEKRLRELQEKAPANSNEAVELAKAIFEILRITKPHIYEITRALSAVPTAGVLTAMLGSIFPDKREVLTDIFGLLK